MVWRESADNLTQQMVRICMRAKKIRIPLQDQVNEKKNSPPLFNQTDCGDEMRQVGANMSLNRVLKT